MTPAEFWQRNRRTCSCPHGEDVREEATGMECLCGKPLVPRSVPGEASVRQEQPVERPVPPVVHLGLGLGDLTSLDLQVGHTTPLLGR